MNLVFFIIVVAKLINIIVIIVVIIIIIILIIVIVFTLTRCGWRWCILLGHFWFLWLRQGWDIGVPGDLHSVSGTASVVLLALVPVRTTVFAITAARGVGHWTAAASVVSRMAAGGVSVTGGVFVMFTVNPVL